MTMVGRPGQSSPSQAPQRLAGCRPDLTAVSAGSARCAVPPAVVSSSTTYRHPVQPSTAISASQRTNPVSVST
jgi:hypothetical protein